MGAERLEILAALSRRYGSDPAWVLAGGGNTSYKDASTLWVKASGTHLAAIGPEGFCAMDRGKLSSIWERTYPSIAAEREAAVLSDLLSARAPGEAKRPSVETLLHGFLPQSFVVHTHPSAVNGMTCGLKGEEAFRELFADEAVWVPLVDPGYILALTARKAVEEFKGRTGRFPAIMFLQNHGMLVAADSPEEITRLSALVAERIAGRLVRRPDRTPRSAPADELAKAAAAIAALAPAGSRVLYALDADIEGFAADKAAFAPLSAAFSPDHIVYAGHEFLRVDDASGLSEAWREYKARIGRDPRIAVVARVGAFGVAGTPGAAETAMALFLDACSVAVYSESFGGPLHMTEEMVDFILNWEAEHYRAKTSPGGGEKT